MILPMTSKVAQNVPFLSTNDTQNRYLEFMIWVTLVKQEYYEINISKQVKYR